MTFIQLFIGQVYYAILVAEISTILHSMDTAKSAFEETMNATNAYVRKKKLPGELRDKIRDYMRARYKDGRMVNEPAVLSSLSPALKREVMTHCAIELAVKVPWLRNNPVLHSRVSEIAVPRFALDGDVLLREGELGHTVFIVSQGVVELFKTYNNGWEESEPQLIRAVGGKCDSGVAFLLHVLIARVITSLFVFFPLYLFSLFSLSFSRCFLCVTRIARWMYIWCCFCSIGRSMFCNSNSQR